MQTDFEQIYEQYYSVVYRYLLSLTKDKHLAEDFTQETFYKALKSIDTYNSEMKMLSWLCTIAKNTYFTWAKRHKKQQTLSEIDEVHTDDIIESERSLVIPEAANREISATVVLKNILEGLK